MYNYNTRELAKDPLNTVLFDATETVAGAEYIVEKTTRDPLNLVNSKSTWTTTILQGTSKPSPQQVNENVSSLSTKDKDQISIDKFTTDYAENP